MQFRWNSNILGAKKWYKHKPYWTQLINQIDSQKYEIVEVFNYNEDRQAVLDYLTKNMRSKNASLRFLFAKNDELQKYKLSMTPTTIVLDENSKVEKVWSGLWDKSKIVEVNSYFNMAIH